VIACDAKDEMIELHCSLMVGVARQAAEE
jgi:hypothetical protein